MARPVHPCKEIEAAVAYAEEHGWRWIRLTGHGWGKLLCPRHDRDGCTFFVWSTPKHREAHAKALIRAVDRCQHAHGDA